MCSTGDEGLRDMIPDASEDGQISQTAGICNKCGCHAECTYKLKFREAECRECFLAYVCHKFRAALGSSKILPRAAKVLVVYDGSAEATTLLDMLYAAQTQSTYKRLHCSASVLYIDDTCSGIKTTAETTTQLQREQLQQVHDFLQRYPEMPCYMVPLQSNSNASNLHDLKRCDEYLDGLEKSKCSLSLANELTAIRSLSARQDYIRQLRQRLIVAAANQLSCGFAFLPDISTTVATQLLTAVALGRGGSVALDVALCDERFVAETGVKIVRPIRDLTQPEVELYLHAKDLKSLNTSGNSPHTDGTSIHNLTKAFVNGLQNNYNSTVSTIFRTGNKIATNVDGQQNKAKCEFCAAPLDGTDSATLLAIDFSRLVSSTATTLLDAENVVSTAKTKVAHESGLCHACANIQNETANKELLST